MNFSKKEVGIVVAVVFLVFALGFMLLTDVQVQNILTGAVVAEEPSLGVSDYDFGTDQLASSTSCGFVNSDLTLSSNVGSNGSCFIVNASRITIDCGGYRVDYAQNASANNPYWFDFAGTSVEQGSADSDRQYDLVFQNCVLNESGQGYGFTTFPSNLDSLKFVNITYLDDSRSFEPNNWTNVTFENVVFNITGTGQVGFLSSGSSGRAVINSTFYNFTIIGDGGDNGPGLGVDSSTGDYLYGNTWVNLRANTDVRLTSQMSNNTGNKFLYNNSFGTINWTDNSTGGFLDTLAFGDTPAASYNYSWGLGNEIYIQQNNISINVSYFYDSLSVSSYDGNINSSATLTFTDRGTSGYPYAILDGSLCSSLCSDVTSLGSGVYEYNVTSWPAFGSFQLGLAQGPQWNSQTSSGTTAEVYELQINWEGVQYPIETVLVESNHTGSFVNYTMSLLSGNETSGTWNYTGGLLSQGTYFWRVFANDTNGGTNTTELFNHTVGLATPEIIFTVNSNSSTSISVEQTAQTFFDCQTNIVGLELTLYEDGASINSSSGNVSAKRTYADTGSVDVSCNSTSNATYSAASAGKTITVNTLSDDPPTINYQNQGVGVGLANEAQSSSITGNYNGSNNTIYATVLDDVEVSTVYFNLGDGFGNRSASLISGTVINGIWSIDIKIGVGNYTWAIYAVDSAGNKTEFPGCLFGPCLQGYPIQVYQGNSSDYLSATVNYDAENNVTITSGDSVPISCLMSNQDPDAYNYLYNNGTLVNEGSGWNLTNVTTFTTVGLYNISCQHIDSQNYTGSWSNEVYVNVTALDTDGDGIADDIDKFLGTLDNVSTEGITSLNVTVGGNDSSGTFTGAWMVNFSDNGTTLFNFTFNFSAGVLDISNVTVNVSNSSSANGIIIDLGGQLQGGFTKDVYLNDEGFTQLCVEDAEITTIGDISDSCGGSGEVDFSACIGASSGTTIGAITCYDLGSQFLIENLTYSGIEALSPSSSGSSGGSSGGGGGGGSGSSSSTTQDVVEEIETPEISLSPEDCRSGFEYIDGDCVASEEDAESVDEQTDDSPLGGATAFVGAAIDGAATVAGRSLQVFWLSVAGVVASFAIALLMLTVMLVGPKGPKKGQKTTKRRVYKHMRKKKKIYLVVLGLLLTASVMSIFSLGKAFITGAAVSDVTDALGVVDYFGLLIFTLLTAAFTTAKMRAIDQELAGDDFAKNLDALEVYVAEELHKGRDPAVLTSELIQAGWSKEEIQEVFDHINGNLA